MNQYKLLCVNHFFEDWERKLVFVWQILYRMMLPFQKKASVSDKSFRQEHVFQIFKLSFSEFKLAFLLNFIGFHRFSSLNKVFVLGFLFIQCVPVGLVLFSWFVIGFLGWLVRHPRSVKNLWEIQCKYNHEFWKH